MKQVQFKIVERPVIHWQSERPATPGCASIWWLGQAGFAIRYGELQLLIDPYLSDFLAEKYRGKQFPHQRMMPTPMDPSEITSVDFVLCTHAHSDHMDSQTLPIVAEHVPNCHFVVPAAETCTAHSRGVPLSRVLPINAGEDHVLSTDVNVEAIPAAHEELKTNELGEHLFLGYVLRLRDLSIYHSGDSIPFEGLPELLRDQAIDVALLPVNGRDEYRRRNGIPGNFTMDEAVELCRQAEIPILICHHFGMFEFNTAPVDKLHEAADACSPWLRCIVPTIGCEYRFSAESPLVNGRSGTNTFSYPSI